MKKALHEALYDTGIAALINFPLSYLITSVGMEVFHMQALGIAFINFLVLTVVAVTRKTMVRLKFAKREASM